ncbi:YegP family protein [Fundidesulfovibrio soli]|uniref:YegP family protein n=1 Tax=Fundidesulfovibrio soli TaxID=2922716 RepID=UPI001FAFB3BD|nr:YegP family protein [Fundidesulfovibrio soli]
MSAYFKLFKASNGQYFFTLHSSGNHETVLNASETYHTKQGAQNGIDSVKSNAPAASNYTKQTDASGQYRFRLQAQNNKAIGVSEAYTTAQNRDNGITWVMNNAPGATTVDHT